jgi:hypothetical protein
VATAILAVVFFFFLLLPRASGDCGLRIVA